MMDWLSHFPVLDQVNDPEGMDALRSAQAVHLPPGKTVFRTGDACNRYLLVVGGRIRVQQVSAQGREIVLYRVGRGESCILTTACLLSHGIYPASGVTETVVEALTLSAAAFQRAVDASAGFRHFVFQAYGQRLTEMLTVVEEVVFTRMDVRLARRLLSLSNGSDRLAVTHYELAVELGSAREVISRALKDFENRGWVRRNVGLLEILDRRALEHLASG